MTDILTIMQAAERESKRIGRALKPSTKQGRPTLNKWCRKCWHQVDKNRLEHLLKEHGINLYGKKAIDRSINYYFSKRPYGLML